MPRKKAVPKTNLAFANEAPQDSQVVDFYEKWKPRDYQIPLWEFFLAGGKRAITIWHRRAGKDLTAMHLMALNAIQRPGMYLHIFPQFNQGRKIIWEGRTKEGMAFLDAFPKEFISHKVDDEMKLELINGSVYRVVGANNIDSFRGLNAVGVILSEYAFMNPEAWKVLRPILDENGGFAWFVTTPKGKNHAYKLFQYANTQPNWFSELLNINDTGVLPLSVIDEAIAEGMSKEEAEREYLCTFEETTEGSYYGEYIKNAYRENRINPDITHNSNKLVYTSWDLGVDDETTIWFWQEYKEHNFALIDSYSNRNYGLEHYINVINSKSYTYGKHFAPHDINVREFGSGQSRIDIASSLGLQFERHKPGERILVEDGIQAARQVLPNCYFNSKNCELGIEALQAYHKEYDAEKLTYINKPVHDWSSHFADSFRYGALKVSEMRSIRRETLPQYAINDYDPLSF